MDIRQQTMTYRHTYMYLIRKHIINALLQRALSAITVRSARPLAATAKRARSVARWTAGARMDVQTSGAGTSVTSVSLCSDVKEDLPRPSCARMLSECCVKVHTYSNSST